MNFTQKLFFSLTLAIFLAMFTPNVYADSTENDVTWQIIFISDDSSCKTSEKNRINEIVDLTQQYFELYKLSNQMIEPVCIFSLQYFENNTFDESDLKILVFDHEIGNDVFVKYGYEGLYSHFGSDRSQNHVIMVVEPTQFSSAYEFTEPSWNLTHQISHFVLSYYGYNLESIERLLHSSDLEYEDCSNKIGDALCSKIKSTIRSGISGKTFSVVAPISDIVNQNSLKYYPDDLYTSQVVKELQRKITNWWLDGVINDELYLNSIKKIIDVKVNGDKEIQTIQLSIPNGFSIIDKTLKNKNSVYSNESLIIPLENKIYDSLKYVPFQTNSLLSESSDTKIPDWFKNRAKIWADQKLDDRIFFDGLNALVRNGYIQEN